MKKMRFYLALLCSKVTYILLKILKRKASHLPGLVAIKIYPDYLKEAKRFNKVICITGTNGKTTTTNMISDILIKCGYKIQTNRQGANINTGIATVITNGLKFSGRPKVDIIVLETDERYSRLIFPFVNPDFLIVTNIFRDSLKRNAHTEYIFDIINKYTPEKTKVILNAEDLCSSNLLEHNNRVYFGIDKLDTDLTESKNIINDCTICPKCSTKLLYNYLRYHHIGNAYCPNCDFKSKEATYKIVGLNFQDLVLALKYDENEYIFPIINKAIFNIYNELSAIAFAFEFGIEYSRILEAIKSTNVVDTRLNEVSCGNLKIVQAMAKGQSSVSMSRTLDFISNEPENKVVILIVDDYYERKDSSEFIGWIYDSDFEFLNKENIKQVLATGPRCYDYKIRLLMAGIDKDKILCETDEFESIKDLKTQDIEKIYILYDTSTYDLACKYKEELISSLEKGEQKNEN